LRSKKENHKKKENIIVALKLFKERKKEGSWRARKGRENFILTPKIYPLHSINDKFGGNLPS
jgi:hypothetical protein